MATAEEIRRAREETSIFAPLFEYARSNRSQLASEGRRPVLGGLLSKEPVMGADTLRYEGVGSLLATLLDPIARGVDAPRAAAQGLIPQEDMIGEAFGTAGTAMLGGGVAAKPAGSLGANTLRVYHGGPKKLSASEVEMRPDPEGTPIGFSVTDNPDVAEYYRKMRGGGSISEFDIDLDKANIISESELYEFIDDLENKLDADASYEQIQKGLLDAGIDAIEYPDPEFGIRVVNPNILGANASKSAGLLSVASDVSDRGNQILNMLKSGKGSEVTDAMLDMGDSVKNTQLNQYLAANYDLPMDEASRLVRAREMGFEGGLLHGTGSDITAVDPSKLGGKQNVLGKGFYQTTNPQRSDRYVPKVKGDDGSLIFAEGGNVMPLMTKSADEFDLTVPTGKENITRIANAFEGSDYDVELRDGGDSVFIQSKTDPSISVFLDSYSEGQNTLMRLKDAFGNNNITPILQEAGFTGVKGVESRGSNVRVNYNPQDVRSQFARFDPRLAHLSNVTAANASPISGLLAQSGVSSEQAQEIEDYLARTGLLQ
jgi:hypothetical protein